MLAASVRPPIWTAWPVSRLVDGNTAGHFAHRLMQEVFGEGNPDFSQLRAEHLTAFVQARAEKRVASCKKDSGYAVLALLRFLFARDLIPDHLQYAVPRVPQRQHAGLPRFLTTEGLQRILALPVAPTVKGLRDRAMPCYCWSDWAFVPVR